MSAAPAPFDVNDVSILWPAPKSAADSAKLVSSNEALLQGGRQLWPAELFSQVIDLAPKIPMKASSGDKFSIAFADPAAFRNQTNWKVAGIRFDPTAPGASEAALRDHGCRPEIRVILQPVTLSGDKVKVHDYTAHLVFDFITGFEPPSDPSGRPRALPDRAAYARVVESLVALRAACNSAGVATAGDLRVHPGFTGNVPNFTQAIRDLLTRHLTVDRLNAISFMGVDEPEPWIFFALFKDGNGKFVRAPQSRMFLFPDDVTPVPANRQFSPDAGVSTAMLFKPDPISRLQQSIFPAATDPLQRNMKLHDVADFVANPNMSHFFTTDCVSCHTESTRRIDLKLQASAPPYRYIRPAGISGVSEDVLPKETWNVRNFGWFPGFFKKGVFETATVRTGNESAESADFINRQYLASAQPPPAVAADLPAEAQPVDGKGSHPVANALTLVMDIKSEKDFRELKALLEEMQSEKRGPNPVREALDRLAIVHFARFTFIGNDKLAVITSFDGDFERYIGKFTRTIGPVFDQLLVHMKDAPPLPVQSNPEAFLKYVQDHDLGCVEPFYSAYPKLSVQQIKAMQQEAEKR